MAITSYSSLKTAIADWLDRDDVDTVADTWIDMCEAAIARRMRVRDMESALSVTLSLGVATIPTDYLEAKYLYIDGSPSQPLEMKSSEWILREYPQRSSQGKPCFIATSGTDFIFGPFPDSDYTLAGVYYARPTALSTSNETNFLTTNHPDLLLYGSLMHSAPYIGEDARVVLWSAAFDRLLDEAAVDESRDRFSRRMPLRTSVK